MTAFLRILAIAGTQRGCLLRIELSRSCPTSAFRSCLSSARREQYDAERLIRQYGWDAKLTDLLPALVVDCPKRRSGQCLRQVQGGVREAGMIGTPMEGPEDP